MFCNIDCDVADNQNNDISERLSFKTALILYVQGVNIFVRNELIHFLKCWKNYRLILGYSALKSEILLI